MLQHQALTSPPSRATRTFQGLLLLSSGWHHHRLIAQMARGQGSWPPKQWGDLACPLAAFEQDQTANCQPCFWMFTHQITRLPKNPKASLPIHLSRRQGCAFLPLSSGAFARPRMITSSPGLGGCRTEASSNDPIHGCRISVDGFGVRQSSDASGPSVSSSETS